MRSFTHLTTLLLLASSSFANQNDCQKEEYTTEQNTDISKGIVTVGMPEEVIYCLYTPEVKANTVLSSGKIMKNLSYWGDKKQFIYTVITTDGKVTQINKLRMF